MVGCKKQKTMGTADPTRISYKEKGSNFAEKKILVNHILVSEQGEHHHRQTVCHEPHEGDTWLSHQTTWPRFQSQETPNEDSVPFGGLSS